MNILLSVCTANILVSASGVNMRQSGTTVANDGDMLGLGESDFEPDADGEAEREGEIDGLSEKLGDKDGDPEIDGESDKLGDIDALGKSNVIQFSTVISSKYKVSGWSYGYGSETPNARNVPPKP